MAKTPTIQPWRIVAAEIIAAMKADPDSLRSIYEDREFRPARNASVWVQLSARLAQARKAYREAVAKGCIKEVQHTMLRRCFAHDYSCPGSYMITMTVPERGSNPFGIVKGDMRQGRIGMTLIPEEARRFAGLAHGDGPLRLELTPLGAAMLEALEGIQANYPMVKVRKAQLMPDHLHLILVVTAPIVSSKGTSLHLGHIIAGYKKGCNRLYWQISSMGKPWNTQTSNEPSSDAASDQHSKTEVMHREVSSDQHSKTKMTHSEVSSDQHSKTEVMHREKSSVAMLSIGCDERFPRSYKVPSDASTGRPSLWAAGYTDTIIINAKHMATEVAYLDDNIYRLRMKQLHRDLFRKVLHIRINGKDFAALGNIHLLRKAQKKQVQFHHWEGDVPAGFCPGEHGWNCQRFCSLKEPRNTFTLGMPITGPTEAEAHTERLLKAGDEGAVFVSPFISETEKALREAALTMGISYIRLTREGFRDLYTPSRSEFEACCEGRLLLLAPWEDRKRTTTITRNECVALNKVASIIAGDDLLLSLVKDKESQLSLVKNNDLQRMPSGDNDALQSSGQPQNDNYETINPRDDE